MQQAVNRFGGYREVEYAEPNYILYALQVDDPGLSNQWAPQKIDAPSAWAITTGDPAVIIAVVDSGVDYRHSELAPNIWVNSGEVADNGLDDDGNGYIDDVKGWDFINGDADPFDDYRHGTHVAGSAAAVENENPEGLVGICPSCTLMPVKVLDAGGSGPLDVVANGITYAADNGARVINLSLGATVGSATLEQAVNYAWGQGAVVVAGAGNNGAEMLFYPAAYANAIAVASTNADDYHSCFSNYGSGFIDVAAPGESIYSTLPQDELGNDTYGMGFGTSMSTPHVSGLAGLLFSQLLTRTNTVVRNLIESTTVDLGPSGTDAYFGTGRINAARALAGETTPTTPPTGLFSNFQTASGYAHARKLARDDEGTLHLAWHAQEGSEYRVLHATSTDGGDTWSTAQVVFGSTAETYHPGLAVDGTNVYIAFPSKDGAEGYRTFFTSKPLSGGSWSTPVPLTDSAYDAVRPDIFVDPSNGRLHIVASSLEDAAHMYYTASSDGGQSWGAVRWVDPTTPTTASNTRYATVHANGDNIYIAARTVAQSLFTVYYLHTVRSTDGGETWFDQTKISSYTALLSGEYGVSLAGIGDRLYMAYEVGGNQYFRRFDGTGWSDYLQLESSGRWPSITQADDGQAWMIWENAGSLLMRHYTGSVWEPAETVLEAGGLLKGYYPNLKLGTSGGLVEWVATACNGAPYRLMVDSRPTGADAPPFVSIEDPVEGQTVSATYSVLVSASDDNAVSKVELRIDAGAYLDITSNFDSGHYFYDWDTTVYDNGGHTLQARATDDAAQSTESEIVAVTVDNNQPPAATFTCSCTALTCDFDASGSSDPDGALESYNWSFGDGNTGSGATTSHTYAVAGSYTIVLTVTDDDGATDDDVQDITVTEPATMHVGDLDGTKASVRNKWTATVTISVHDSSHSLVSGATVIGVWSDGATGTSECTTDGSGQCDVSKEGIPKKVSSVVFTVSNVTHATLSYQSADNHDPDGDSDGTAITVPPPVNQPPVATFTYACTDLSCDFDASDSYDPDGSIISYDWDFGDGNTGTGATTSHTYAVAGSYTIVLTVADNDSAADMDSQEVTVGSIPGTMFVYDIAMSGKKAGPNLRATAVVTIHDTDGNPVEGAAVYGTWSGAYAGSVSGVTGADGKVLFNSGKVRLAQATFAFTADDVIKSGYVYDSAFNIETSDSVDVP